MDMEKARADFEEICEKAEAFMKKYGSHNAIIVITDKEIKIMGTQMFKEFGKDEK